MGNVLLQGRIAADHCEIFNQYTDPDWTISVWDPALDEPEAFTELAREADVICGGNIPLDQWPPTPKLKLFQIPWTGYNFTTPERMPNGVPVANCFEHETAIAEYILLGMLEWRIGLRKMDQLFRSEGWAGRYPAGGNFHDEVAGNTVGIIGYGHIGEEVAKRAVAFGMRVVGIRRTPQPTPAWLDWLGGTDKLDQLLDESDFVVVGCDLNDDTRNLINQSTLGKMKPAGVLINVSRGAVVNEKDLFRALKSNAIGGAIIDVWYNYNNPGEPDVWPCNEPFQELDNVILSGHECGWTHQQLNRRWQFVAANVARVLKDDQPENIVFTGRSGQT